MFIAISTTCDIYIYIYIYIKREREREIDREREREREREEMANFGKSDEMMKFSGKTAKPNTNNGFSEFRLYYLYFQ